MLFSEIYLKHLKNELPKLPTREQDVLTMRFGLLDGAKNTLEECGKALGVTRERIRQIEAKALARIDSSFAEQSKNSNAKRVAVLDFSQLQRRIIRLLKFKEMAAPEIIIFREMLLVNEAMTKQQRLIAKFLVAIEFNEKKSI